MIKRILVALSGTPCTPSAITHAVELSQVHQAELTGVTIFDPERLQDVGPVPLGGGAAAHELAEHRTKLAKVHIEEAVALFEKACGDAGLEYRVLRESGDTASRLLADWRYHDLTIIGLRGLFEYGVLHDSRDLVLDVIGAGLRPLLAVAEEHRSINRAMIAYDGSPLAARAMKAFCMLDIWPPIATSIACFNNKEGEDLLDEAARYVEAHGVNPETMLRSESVRPHLLDAVEEWDADLLIMGAARRSRLGRKLLGDTARFVLENATRPVFIHH